MFSTRLRPRCRYISELPKQKILKQIEEHLENQKKNVEGMVVQDHAFIRINEKDQHYWSPEMHVWVREEEKETIIYGVIGPKPKIWTFFVFAYTVILVSAFFGVSYGIIQFMLGIKAEFLWSIPASIAALAIVYFAAYVGQFKGKEQTIILFDFLHEVVNPAQNEKSSR